MVDQDGDLTALPALGTDKAGADTPPVHAPAADRDGALEMLTTKSRGPSPWHLRNWRVRWRLLALVIIPTVAAIVLGVVRIQAARDTAAGFTRVDKLAVLGADVTALANAIADERDITAGYLATVQSGRAGESKTLLGELNRQYAVTGKRVTAVTKDAAAIGPAYPAVARTDLSFALSRVSAVPDLRALVHSEMPAEAMVADYSGVVSTLIAFDNEISAGTASAQLAQTVSSLSSLAQMEDQASQQRAILYAALLRGNFGPGELSALTAAQSAQASDLATFDSAAANLPAFTPGSGITPALTVQQQFNNEVAGPGVDVAQSIEQDAIINADNGQAPPGNAQTWFTDMSANLADIRGVEDDELASITAQANTLHSDAENSETLTAILVLVLLLIVFTIAILIARSMIVPLRRLRSDALDVAGHRLPDMVRRLSESQGSDKALTIEPVGINSTDEIGEVAKAFDQVHREAVRLAGDEALLRANLNAMFVNLSRRSQSLIERQLGIIDSLEQSEQDPDRLSSLFRLDHLATRMRRNSENLLVLAGHDAPRKWSQPVPLVDVLRAAISEIEQYDRITLNVQPGIVVTGRAASDVVHLVAEIVENATTFSPEVTKVMVTGQEVSTGGVLLDITDEGLGITEQDLEYANWRLDNPPVVDVAVSRRMGLFVVGRLAARHGIRVRLQHAHGGGLTALIWLPDTVAETEDTPSLGTLRRRFDVDRYSRAAMTTLASGAATVPVPAPAPRWSPPPVADTPVTAAPVTAAPVTGAPVTETPVARPLPEPLATLQSERATGGPAQLPIYDSVESDWFRRSGDEFTGGNGAGSWRSPADEGFRAAQAVAAPAIGDTTAAGLPRRLPSANLVPGSVGSGGPPAPAGQAALAGQAAPGGLQEPARGRMTGTGAPSRTANEVRGRMTGLQRGIREGRAAAPVSYWTDES